MADAIRDAEGCLKIRRCAIPKLNGGDEGPGLRLAMCCQPSRNQSTNRHSVIRCTTVAYTQAVTAVTIVTVERLFFLASPLFGDRYDGDGELFHDR
jgi:hypothetical protein